MTAASPARARVLPPGVPDLAAVLAALGSLSRDAPLGAVGRAPGVDAASPSGALRADLLSVVYRLLFAELATAAGVPVGTDEALAGLALRVVDRRLPGAEEARASLAADPAWTRSDVVGLGRLHEWLLDWRPVPDDGRWTWRRDGRARKAAGAYFTPPTLVGRLLDRTWEPALDAEEAGRPARLLDPACGAGAFLVPAVRRVRRRLAHPPEAALARVRGVDLDPAVLELARVCLWLDPLTDAGSAGCQGSAPTGADLMAEVALVAGDVLTLDWSAAFPSPTGERGDGSTGVGADVVVGNPPFANQLERLTARDRPTARRLSEDGGGAVAAYTDLSAVFLARSLSWVEPGGRVGLVQPQSLLAARDAAPVRRTVAAAGAVEWCWAGDAGLFDAQVPTCALVVGRGAPQRLVQREHGPDFSPLPDLAVSPEQLTGEWGFLLAAGLGVPQTPLVTHGALGDLATCTADFRDQYYGLAPYVHDADDPVVEPGRVVEPGQGVEPGLVVEPGRVVEPGQGVEAGQGVEPGGASAAPLITSGLIDPAVCHWGRRPTRFLKQAWQAPAVDLTALAGHPTLGPWSRRRLVPKVLLATQGRTLEAVADPAGRWLPSVPVISVVPREPADVWRVLAVLLAPPVAALAATRYAGTALSPGAIKLSARQVALLPLPADEEAWLSGAAAVRRAQLATTGDARAEELLVAGRRLCTAYGVLGEAADELMAWWGSRLPRR